MAEPVIGAAFLELADTVVLATEGDEIGHPRPVAAFNVRAQKLAALRKAEGVDGRGSGEDRVRFEVGTHFLDLFCKISEESGGAVGGSVVVDAYVVCECARIGFVHEGADRAKPLGIVAGALSEIWNLQRAKALYLSPNPCHTTRGRNGGESARDNAGDLGGTTAKGFWREAAEQVTTNIQAHKKNVL